MKTFLSESEIIHPTPHQLAAEKRAAAVNAKAFRHRVGEARALAHWRVKWETAQGLKQAEPFVFYYWLAYGRALGKNLAE
jgi:hypothetical protein